jgi:hypothetical protein
MDDITRQDEANQAATQPQEKLLPQSEVNDIVGRARISEREKVMRQMQAQQEAPAQSYQQPMQQQQEAQPQAPSVDMEAITKQISDQVRQEQEQQKQALLQAQQEQEMQNLAQEYYGKMSEGAKQFDDFDDIMKDFDPSEFPEIVTLATRLPNTAAVMRELRANPSKLVTINSLAQSSGRLAEAELKKLSDSIQMNMQAQEDAQANQTQAPLDRLQPSRVTGNNGKRSIRDLRADPAYRV